MRVTLTINKKSVYEEVGKAASYVGAKMDADTYDRMMVTDENEELLDSFWEEAKTTALNSLKEWLAEGKEDAGNFTVALELPPSFRLELKEAMQSGLFSFFVQTIVAKWFMITNKEEAGAYATAASGFIEQVHKAMYERKRPQRPK